MAENDFRAKLGRQDFQESLKEKSTEQIKIELKTNRIAHPDKRALAEMEVERRQEESELNQVKAELDRYKKRLGSQTWISVIATLAAVAIALAAWWPSND